MDKRLLSVAVAGLLATPAAAFGASLSHGPVPMEPRLTGWGGYGGRMRSNRVRKDRIAAYKRQRAANRQRRKLLAR